MSKPAPGGYFISNAATRDAVTFNGRTGILTVTRFDGRPTQVWRIRDYTDGVTQYISPKVAPDLQVNFRGKDNLTVSPPGGYVWAIRKDNEYLGTYTIQNGNFTLFWGIQSEDWSGDQPVFVSPETGEIEQRWYLFPTT